MKAKLSIIWVLISGLAFPAVADPSPDQPISDFQLIVRQGSLNGETVMTGLNLAFGHGADVQFFSNIEDLGANWVEDPDTGVRSAILNTENGNVVLGVCASSGECQVSNGISFTQSVGMGGYN